MLHYTHHRHLVNIGVADIHHITANTAKAVSYRHTLTAEGIVKERDYAHRCYHLEASDGLTLPATSSYLSTGR